MDMTDARKRRLCALFVSAIVGIGLDLANQTRSWRDYESDVMKRAQKFADFIDTGEISE